MMTRCGWKQLAVVLVVALAMTTLPMPVQAASGDSSTGAAVTIGLMVAVVAVYGLVALRSDVERYTENEREDALVRAARKAEESPIVVHAITRPVGLETSAEGAPMDLAGAAIGWRITF